MEKEENISEEEVEKVYEAVLGRVKKFFLETVAVDFAHLRRRNDSTSCSTVLGVEVFINSRVSRQRFMPLRFMSQHEDGRREYVS